MTYRGLFADQHLVDAQQFGKSLIGVTKLANSVCHEIFHEEITHDPRSYQIRFCVGPSKKNGLIQEIVFRRRYLRPDAALHSDLDDGRKEAD